MITFTDMNQCRYVVINLVNGEYGILDQETDERVNFNSEMDEWQNAYSARGYAQRLESELSVLEDGI